MDVISTSSSITVCSLQLEGTKLMSAQPFDSLIMSVIKVRENHGRWHGSYKFIPLFYC